MLYLDKYQTSVLVTSFVESLFVYLALAWEGPLFFSLCPLEGEWEREKKQKKFSKSAEQFHDGKFFEDQFRISLFIFILLLIAMDT